MGWSLMKSGAITILIQTDLLTNMSKAEAHESRRSREWAHIQSMMATLVHIYTMRQSGSIVAR